MEVVRECWLMTLAKMLETRGEGSYEELLTKLQNGEIGEMEIAYPVASGMSGGGYKTEVSKIDLAKPLIFFFQTYKWGDASYKKTTVGTDSTRRLKFNVSEEGQMKIVAFWIPRIDNPLLVRDLFSCGVLESFVYLAEGRVVERADRAATGILAWNTRATPPDIGEVTRKLFCVGNEINPIMCGQHASP